ncbi:hypothetical protein P3S68_018892 [Capsicum galapagoense]
MKFTKNLLTTFLIMTILRNIEAFGDEKMSCPIQCAFLCFYNTTVPDCVGRCVTSFCPRQISPEELKCDVACANQNCSKIEPYTKEMERCLDSCSTKCEKKDM